MTYQHIHYELQDGYVHTWLVAGPQHTSLEMGVDLTTTSGRLDGLARQAETSGRDLDFTTQPVEPATLSEGEVTVDDYSGRWRIVHCPDDHFVDLSEATQSGHLRAWAYTGLESATPQRVTLTLTTTDFADIWVNGAHVHRELRTASHSTPFDSRHVTGTFEVILEEGINDVVVRFETGAPGPAPFVFALKVTAEQAPAVVLRTLVLPVERRQRLETVFQTAYMKQYVFDRYDRVVVTWTDDDEVGPAAEEAAAEEAGAARGVSMTMRVQTPEGRIYAESQRTGGPGNLSDMGFAYRYPNGPLEAILMPHPQEYYEGNMRVSRVIPFWGLNSEPYTETPAGTFQERRQAALISAARREANVYSEIAKMAIGWWSRLEQPLTVDTALRLQKQGPAVDYTSLLGLIGMLARFGEDASFPEAFRQPIDEAIVNAPYRGPEPTTAEERESRALLSAACEILAGQLYPELTFAASGESGRWHQTRGEEQALSWIHARSTRGFHAAGSDTVYAETVLALAHLLDLADSDALWEMASVLLDKVLFLLAVNSYKGVFGSARMWTTTPAVLGGYLEATSGIAKLMWGTGVYNTYSAAGVSLAILETYELPVMLQAIATDMPESVWSQEYHGPQEPGVTTVTYKTPDFMLSAAQDAQPGIPGSDEHVWQATLGPGATVFVNHPVCAGLSDAQRPNFWRGNGVRPRVVQWRDALIALYALPAGDWMGFTHAYFPIHAFDANALRDDWAFARKGDGYLALSASGGLNLISSGHSAGRELRSPGQQAVWLCQMGRASLDGDFQAFQARVLALPLAYAAPDTDSSPGVRWTTLRGDALQLDWTGPFLKNGEITPVTVDGHIDNPYCVAPFPAEVMDIRYDDIVMRLTFETP